ncbi:MAG: glycosyltransferase [Planctomycetota bacterium]|nr:glycosyltransferase [Planctomycetota bacterium]
MHVLFIHQNFPAQFRYIAPRLVKDFGYRCTFVTERVEGELPGVEKILYKPRGGATAANHPLTRNFENTIAHAHGVFDSLKARRDLKPDLIVAHTGFGSSLFVPFLFDAPIINFLEFFYSAVGQDMGFRPEIPVEEMHLLRSKTSNAMILLDTVNCDRGWTPTHYQREFFPAELRSKIEVIFDGIDTAVYFRKSDALERVRQELKIPEDHRIVTYVARGFEMMRGFDIFMKAAQRIYQQFDKVTFIVVGTDRIHYGSDAKFIKEKTFRHHVLAQSDFDLSRFRFTGYVPQERLADYLSSADVHIYLTEPFIASWSMVNAMACGAVLVASDQTCVREYVIPGKNGLLENFFDVEAIAARTVEVLRDPLAFRHIGEAAIATVVEKFSLDVAIPRIKTMFETVAAGKRLPKMLLEDLVKAGSLAETTSEPAADLLTAEPVAESATADKLDADSDVAKAMSEIRRISATEQKAINWPQIVQSYRGPAGPLETIGPPNHPIDLARLLQRLSEWQAQTILELGNTDLGTIFLWTRVLPPSARIILVPLPMMKLPEMQLKLLPQILRPKQELKLLSIAKDPEWMDKTIDEALGKRPLDFVFMHGRRPFKELSADFRRIRKKVRAGGLMAWDGINPTSPSENTLGGDQLWTEVRPLYPQRAEYLNGVVNEIGGIAMIKV